MACTAAANFMADDDDAGYAEALSFIASFDRHCPRRAALEQGTTAGGAGRAERPLAMVLLAERLGNPERLFRSVHVAGTKGKGSTAALCASALRAAGYRVGLYTSPHLLDYTERFQIDGAAVSRRELVETLASVRDRLLPEQSGSGVEAGEQRTLPNAFEVATGLAFVLFARRGVDVAVVEVGIGGRLDATNVVTPLVSVVTPVSYDHTNILGDTLALIAAEKAGIVKPGVPVVCAPQQPEALAVVRGVAAARQCDLTLVGDEVRVVAVGARSLRGQRVTLSDARTGAVVDVELPLLGAHQADNAAAAYAALKRSGLSVSDEHVARGFAGVCWPGRFQVVSAGDVTVVVDAAHNGDSFARLADTLAAYFPGRRVALVFGAARERQPDEMLCHLAPVVARLYATSSLHPLAWSPDDVAQRAPPHFADVQAVATVADALRLAVDYAAASDLIVVAAGSVHVAAQALAVTGK